MPELFFKHAKTRTKNTPNNLETPPVEPSQHDIYYNLQRIQTMISYLLVEKAILRKWITEEVCPKLTPYGIVPPPVTVVEGLPSVSGYMVPPTSADSFWLQDTSLQTIQTLNYYLVG
jgi:hypothetical protein